MKKFVSLVFLIILIVISGCGNTSISSFESSDNVSLVYIDNYLLQPQTLLNVDISNDDGVSFNFAGTHVFVRINNDSIKSYETSSNILAKQYGDDWYIVNYKYLTTCESNKSSLGGNPIKILMTNSFYPPLKKGENYRLIVKAYTINSETKYYAYDFVLS